MTKGSTLGALVVGGCIVGLVLFSSSTGQPPGPGLWFSDVTPIAGIRHVNASGEPGQLQIIDQNGQGAATFDYDGDGWMDVYLANGSTIGRYQAGENPGGRLYRNRGDWTFEDVTEKARVRANAWGLGAAAADYDGDGDADLYLTNWGPNTLYRNNGDGTFTDVTKEAGVGFGTYSSSAAFGDMDGDGDLDLYISNYVFVDPEYIPDREKDGQPCLYKGVITGCGPWVYDGEQDVLYRNDGDGTFTDISEEAGLEASRGYRGFPVLLIDTDLDGDLDVYVGCDVMPNLYLVNQGDGRLASAPAAWGGVLNHEGKHESGMGVGAGDIDGDGDLDLFTTNFAFQTNTLYVNEGGILTDQTTGSGLEAHPEEMGWANGFADLDNDGYLDVFICNGHIYPQVEELDDPMEVYNQPPRLFRGRGRLKFTEAGPRDGWRPDADHSNRGFNFADYDNDGDLDILVVRHREPVTIWRNEKGGRFLTVLLRGKAPNTDGIGARVHIRAGGRDQWAFAAPHQGFQATHDPRIHFGLGRARKVDLLEVHWPSGTVSTRRDVGINEFVTVEE